MSKRDPLLHLVRTVAAAAAIGLGSASVAGAQTVDPPAAPAAPVAPPSYATPVAGETISGHITAVTGKYTLELRDTRGFVDNVTLHPGTIINPRGLTLAAGMQVTINGANAGTTFTANQIDAPYTVALVPGYGFGPAFGPPGIGLGFAPGWGWGPRFRAGLLW